jgi:hypothetical protein
MESPREPPRRGSLSSMLRLAPQRKLRSSPDVEDGDGDDRTPRATEGSPSIGNFGTGVLPTWLTPPVLAPPVQGRRSVESIVWYATIACVALLTFYMLVAPEDMDARYARLAAADAHIPRRLARFEVSTDVVDNLGVVDVEYEYAQPQPGFFGRDRIAAYCVDGGGNETIPDVLDFMAAIPTDGTPSGVVRVGPLINIRCSWVLRFIVLIGDKDTSAVALGQPKHISFIKGPAQPLQLHLAPTQDPYAMRVQWVSVNVTRPVVRFGMDSENLTRVARATETTYRASDLCELRPVEATDANMNPLQAGFRDPGFTFDAVMSRLIPQKVYYYSVGDEATGIMSDEYSFQLPPPPGHQDVAIDEAEMDPYYRDVDGEDHKRSVAMAFLVFGDLNRPVGVVENFTSGATAASRTVTSMTNDILERNGWRKFVAAFHVGDLSRAMGSGYVWDQFGQLIEPVAARVPYLVAVGNHGEFMLPQGSHGAITSSREHTFASCSPTLLGIGYRLWLPRRSREETCEGTRQPDIRRQWSAWLRCERGMWSSCIAALPHARVRQQHILVQHGHRTHPPCHCEQRARFLRRVAHVCMAHCRPHDCGSRKDAVGLPVHPPPHVLLVRSKLARLLQLVVGAHGLRGGDRNIPGRCRVLRSPALVRALVSRVRRAVLHG